MARVTTQFTGIIMYRQDYRERDLLVKMLTDKIGPAMFFVKNAKKRGFRMGIAMVFLLTKFVYSLKSAGKLRSAAEIAGNNTLAVYLLHDLFFVTPFASPLANSVISVFTAFFIPLFISVIYRSLRKKAGR